MKQWLNEWMNDSMNEALINKQGMNEMDRHEKSGYPGNPLSSAPLDNGLYNINEQRTI